MKRFITIFAAVALTFGLVSVSFADSSIYGSSRFGTFFTSVDDGDPATSDADNLEWAQYSNSRFGAKFSDGAVSGRMEYGTGVNLRLLYGTWAFSDSGRFSVGQMYTPMATYIGNQVYNGDNDLLVYGASVHSRTGALQLAYKLGGGMGLQFALVTPSSGDEQSLPKLEGAFTYAADMWNLKVAAAYNSQGMATGDDLDSTLLNVSGGANFGAFFVNGAVSIGTNAGDMGYYGPFGSAAANGTSWDDNDYFAYCVRVGFKASDMLTFEAGYGYAEAETAAGVTDDKGTIYVQAVVNLAKNVQVIPEIGILDEMDNGTTAQGDKTYFGANWKIHF